MEDQVGLYDGKNSCYGCVYDISSKRDQTEILCTLTLLSNNIGLKNLSELEWKDIAEVIIEKLKLNEYDYSIQSVSFNGFILVEL